ncbi:MAG: putative tricarboxylic transport rane protein [Paraburkholderia sp.]|nr:putative tricarboxylic transport rane protein [Paraburkholderia sp.]
MQGLHNPRTRDYVGGALMFLLGMAATVRGTSYGVGDLADMGPGFAPAAIGVILAVTGIAIAFAGQSAGAAASRASGDAAPHWRGWICIVLGIVLFIVCAAYIGLLPATFAIVFVSALGDQRNTVKNAFWLAIAVCVVCVIVFWWGLKIQLPLVHWG